MKYAFICIVVGLLLFSATSNAQIKNKKTEQVLIYGTCDQCKKNIEKSGTIKSVSSVDWNINSKIATITYNVKKITILEVVKKIALAGFDSDLFLAPDDIYDHLPDCCKYDRLAKPKTIFKQITRDTIITEMTKVESRTIVNSSIDTSKLIIIDADSINLKNESTNVVNHAPESTTSKEETTKQSPSKSPENTSTRQSSKIKEPTIPQVFDTYFALKDALVKTDGAEASAKAKQLKTYIIEINMAKLSHEVYEVWMKIVKGLTTDAGQIANTKDISKQRNQFVSLSKNMYDLLKASKHFSTIYYQYCPMANDGKGAYWLSKEIGIKNPYYGNLMLTCGSLKETIQ